MGAKTGIEWTDSTWSPVRFRVRADAAEIARAKGYTSLVAIAEKMAGHVGSHCEHVSPGCEHCYAETNNHRCLPGNGTGLPYDRRARDLVEAFVDEKILLQPLRWGPAKQGSGVRGQGSERPRRIFVENQSDLYGEWVSDEMLDSVKAVMALCPQHIFQVLTKRPERRWAYLTTPATWDRISISAAELKTGGDYSFALDGRGELNLPNVWHGVSVELPKHKDRIDHLRDTPAAVRFLSLEPLLGDLGELDLRGIDWVICGGESGPGARPMHAEWARSVRDQCVAAAVPFFFKQWGEWIESPAKPIRGKHTGGGIFLRPNGVWGCQGDWWDGKAAAIDKVGKKAAGALLDGREWKQFPEARA